MTSLFSHAGAPAGSQFTDGSPGIKVCTTFTFHNAGVGVAGQVTEVWWYCGANTGGTWTAVGWEVTAADPSGAGTIVANQAFAGTPTANAWNKVTLSSPVDIPADYNRRWRFGVHNVQNYWANNDFFNTTDYTNAPITAYRDNDTTSTLGRLDQGTFSVSSSVTAYPAATGSKANYGIDVTFIASGGTTPVTGTLDTPWSVRSAITAALDTPYALRAPVTRSLDTPWASRAQVTASLDTPWGVRAPVASALDTLWSVRGAVSGTLDTLWALRSQISTLLDTSWTVRGRLTSTMQLLWVVEGVAAPPKISNVQVHLTDAVQANVGPDRITAYLDIWP